MASFSFQGFSTESFSVLSFDFGEIDQPSGGSDDKEYYHNLRIAEANRRYKEAKKREEIKQDEVIKLRLESQDIYLAKKELVGKTDKQSKRQLAYLEKQMAKLAKEIQLLMVDLEKLQKDTVKKKNNVLIILLMAACPLSIN